MSNLLALIELIGGNVHSNIVYSKARNFSQWAKFQKEAHLKL